MDSYSQQLTGNTDIDNALTEVYRVLNDIGETLDGKASKELLSKLIKVLGVSRAIIPLKYWRYREAGTSLVWERDLNKGVGTPNWQAFDTYKIP